MMANAAILALLAHQGRDPYRRSRWDCDSGLWLVAGMMILSQKLTPRRVGLSARSLLAKTDQS